MTEMAQYEILRASIEAVKDTCWQIHMGLGCPADKEKLDHLMELVRQKVEEFKKSASQEEGAAYGYDAKGNRVNLDGRLPMTASEVEAMNP